MTKQINVKILTTKSIVPIYVRKLLDKEEIVVDGRNNFEVIDRVDDLSCISRFLCSYMGYFFTIPIEHVRKI
jgi:hypothetical protein